MEQLEKIEQLNVLFSFYGSLLTEKQQNYFMSYYHLDLSLQEIADEIGVSRNAVHDQLKIAIKHLFDFEEKLNLVSDANKRRNFLDLLESTKDFKYIEELRKLDD